MAQCQYTYKIFTIKKCPHEILKNKNMCYWHEKRINKNPMVELGKRDFKNLDLVEANLQGADLRNTNFQGSDLGGANLQEADLRDANIQESDLGKANLQRAYLWDANLQGSYLWDTNLQGAQLWGTNLKDSELWDANFQGAYLKDANFQGAYLFSTRFDNSNLWDAKFIDEIVINEIEGDNEKDVYLKLEYYRQASQIYRNLKNYFRDEGIYETSGHYYYREKVIEKKIYKQKNKVKYLGSVLLDLLCGYGEKPGRIIISSISWAFINSFLYFIWGIQKGQIEIRLSLQATLVENIMNFLNCLYFSFVTFTTLGYGDFHPVGITKAFATMESFTGAFMIALFVLTMGRKMMR